MVTPEETRWFWQQNVNYATEIGRAIHEHVREATPVTRALEPFTNRIMLGLESLRALHRHSQHDFRPDGMTLLRVMYDAHVQALYIIADQAVANERAQLFIDYRWIEQRRMQELIERNDSELARTLLQKPRRSEDEAVREENFQRLRPKYLTKQGKLRTDWYPGTLRDLARQVGLETEYELLQRSLSGAVHSTPTALLAGPTFSDPDSLLLVGWQLVFRVLGRLAQHHSAPLELIHEEIALDAMRILYDPPATDA